MSTLIEILTTPKSSHADSDYVYAQKIDCKFTSESPAQIINLDEYQILARIPKNYEYVVSIISLLYQWQKSCNLTDMECSRRWAIKYINKINQLGEND